MPIGESPVPAIVCCAIFFVFGVLAIYNLVVTKYPWYDILVVSCWFRSVSYACKAAYLGGAYSPALGGTSLAFLNAGYGASVAVICLGLAWWFRNKPYKVYSASVEAAFMWSSIFLCFAVICFGPVTGVVAAGLIFGDYKSLGAGAAGIRCRIAASYGLLVCNTLIIILVAATTIRILTYKSRDPEGKAERDSGKTTNSRKNPRLVGWFLVPGLLLMVRGCTGVTALYETKAFVWQNDHYFYLLDVLPEMLAILIFSWPFILARMASCYPREEEKPADGESGLPGGNPSDKDGRRGGE